MTIFFYFNKLSFRKTFICKLERLTVKQRISTWDGSLSRLIWIYAVCKSLLLSTVAVKELRGLNTLGTFFCLFVRELFFFTFCLLECTQIPFWKGVYSKRKEFAPSGSKVFPFTADPLSEGDKTNQKLPPLKVSRFPFIYILKVLSLSWLLLLVFPGIELGSSEERT